LLEWAFGSGKKGITPVGKRADGSLVESRLSWYANGGFGITTGAGQREPSSAAESLGRALSIKESRECFGCHTTGYVAGQPAPERREMGIRCERCHGPGAAHVRAMQQSPAPANRQILHPGKLGATAQVLMCGVCHGRPPADSDVAALRRIEQSPNTVRFPSQRLVLSRCYNESPDGLSCSRCHDPHTNVSARASDHDRSCLGCHGKAATKCPSAGANCASCHMPREQAMLHSEFADHFIRVVKRSGGKR
jgi:coenzyme F420-reducing hydrogenase gamma subunit